MVMDPKSILFSMPTLCDLAPPVVPLATGAGDGNVFVLHEDDWRQVELVAKADHAAVGRMLDEVRAATRDNREGPGWKNVYVRKEHPTAISSLSLTPQMIRAPFGDIQAQRVALSSGGTNVSQVRGGFALAVPGLGTLYGNAKGENVRSLAIVPARGGIDPTSRDKLNAFCAAHGLEIVDWQRQDWVDPEMTLWAMK
ncbi:MAG: hypothetical protein JWO86_9231 [Myxococcaceae bacterium]|nr:hypothetical protein [Myxococcaceae bacterium]